jgi:hypothetical protein
VPRPLSKFRGCERSKLSRAMRFGRLVAASTPRRLYSRSAIAPDRSARGSTRRRRVERRASPRSVTRRQREQVRVSH